MNFVQNILPAIGFALVVSVVCEGPEMYLNVNDISTYDVIFHSKAFREYGEKLLKDFPHNEHEACEFIYKTTNFKLWSTLGENVRSCMKVSEKDIERHFEEHDQRRFKTDFNRKLSRCISRAQYPDELMDCYVDKSSGYLHEIKHGNRDVSANEKRCVRKEFEEYVTKTNKSNSDRLNCEKKAEA